VKRKNSRTKAPADTDAFQKSLQLLTGRDHSEAELATKLRRRQFSAAEVEKALDRCREYGYVDDRRYALGRARSLMAEGRAVGLRLVKELQRRGIDFDLAASAVETASEDLPVEELLERISFRRFNDFDYKNADSRQRTRVVNYFLRRGFPCDAVLEFFRKKGSHRNK